MELKADATKKEDLPQLGPRLANNLLGKAFDAIANLDREALKKEDGWAYLLKHLEATRGKTKVDLLGDAFTELFIKKDVYRRDGEELSDYESRFRILVRRVEKALTAVASSNRMPSEVFGWFLLNIYMKLDPSDTANVKAKAASYALDDVLSALNTMWSGGSLAQRDAELRRRRKESTGNYMCDGDIEEEVYQADEVEWDGEPEDDNQDDGNESAWYEDEVILANFRDARRALDQARTARGYYPVRNPNVSKGDGKNGYRKGSGKSTGKGDYSDKVCMRCGKKGHIARICPQRPSASKGRGRDGEGHYAGFVGYATAVEETDAAFPCQDAIHWEEDLDNVYDQCEKDAEVLVVTSSAPGLVMESLTGANILAATAQGRGCAIIDSGASENIIGEDTLQELADHFLELDFDPNEEIEVDRRIHKQFTYGNNLTSAGLGLSHLNAGICGRQVEVQAHMVEGATPFLLSAKFLYDMEATINFRSGIAMFKKLSSELFQLERTPSNHLLLPMTAFAGREDVLSSMQVSQRDEAVDLVASASVGTALHTPTKDQQGDPDQASDGKQGE